MEKEIILNIKGIEIHALQWGKPDGEPLLLLHGWLDNAASFSCLAPYLDRYNVIAVDLPGHGLSGHWPEHSHYHFWAGVEDVELILDELNWPTCHLIGHSMGGAIATLYSGTFPDRVKSLTLIDAIGPMAGDAKGTPSRVAKAISEMKKHNPSQAIKPSLDVFIQTRLTGNLKLSEASSKLIMARSVANQEGGYCWNNDKRLKHTSMVRLPEEFIIAFIDNIQCPVLGIFANDGLFNQDQVMVRWQHVKKPYELLWLDGGHHLHMDGNVKDIAHNIIKFIG